MAEDMKGLGRADLTPAELERWLWASAAGLLEPGEEAALASYIADHPQARAPLEEARRCFDAVAARASPSMAGARRQAAGRADLQVGQAMASARRRLFEGLEQCRAELEAGLAAIVVCLRGGLHAAAQRSGWSVSAAAGRPLNLKAGNPMETAAGPQNGLRRQELEAPCGTRITLVMVSQQRIDILVAAPGGVGAGTARLSRISGQGGRVTRVPVAIAPIERGVAQFQRCPAGLLEIEVPGSEAIRIGLA